MNSYTHTAQALLEQQRQQLEKTLRHPRATEQRPSHQGQWRPLAALVRWLTQDPAPRIRLIQRGDREVWQVYDPHSDRTLTFDTEADVRTWLEQRYS